MRDFFNHSIETIKDVSATVILLSCAVLLATVAVVAVRFALFA